MAQEWFLQSTADYGTSANAKEEAHDMEQLQDDVPAKYRKRYKVVGSKVKIYMNKAAIDRIGFNDDQLYEIMYQEAAKKGINGDELTLKEGRGFDEGTEDIEGKQTKGTITINPIIRTQTKTYVRHLMAHEISHYKDEKLGRGHRKHGKSCGGYVDFDAEPSS
jgi:hypothetical protein